MVARVAVQKHDLLSVKITDPKAHAVHVEIARSSQLRCADHDMAQSHVTGTETRNRPAWFERTTVQQSTEEFQVISSGILTPDQRLNFAGCARFSTGALNRNSTATQFSCRLFHRLSRRELPANECQSVFRTWLNQKPIRCIIHP